MANVVVNAVGDQCPIPVVKATKALKAMTEAGTVEVHVDNEIAVQNLTRLASSKGLKSFAEKKEEKLFNMASTVSGIPSVLTPLPMECLSRFSRKSRETALQRFRNIT